MPVLVKYVLVYLTLNLVGLQVLNLRRVIYEIKTAIVVLNQVFYLLAKVKFDQIFWRVRISILCIYSLLILNYWCFFIFWFLGPFLSPLIFFDMYYLSWHRDLNTLPLLQLCQPLLLGIEQV